MSNEHAAPNRGCTNDRPKFVGKVPQETRGKLRREVQVQMQFCDLVLVTFRLVVCSDNFKYDCAWVTPRDVHVK